MSTTKKGSSSIQDGATKASLVEPKRSKALSRVALVGYRACGKTSVGRLLAERLQWRFLDMDDELVNRFGTDIRTWVLRHGWNAFRREERDLLKDLCREERIVVATGGGVVTDSFNRKRLRELFYVVWLWVDWKIIVERLRRDDRTHDFRPPLTELPLEDEVRNVLSRRCDRYKEVAHAIVDAGRMDVLELCDVIAGYFDKEEMAVIRSDSL